MAYSYNPHRHFKIWLSKNRDVFMNLENQMRMIAMRIKNPVDTIHFVYDTSMLNENACSEARQFCAENNFITVDVNDINSSEFSAQESTLFNYYKDEISHLDEGGNLAVASDILRWLSPIFRLGTYTDFDVPVDTSALPDTLMVESPLLLNIGSLKLGSNELVLSNNDYISIVNEADAKEQLYRIQDEIISVLGRYHTDFIENSTAKLGGNGFLNSRISSYMKNRAEAEYIEKSQQINKKNHMSSRKLRAFVQYVTRDTNEFLNFNKTRDEETNTEVIARLRANLADQLGLIKWLFFNKEYQDSQAVLTLSDNVLLKYLMKKECSLYIKSIVICTTGPIVIAKSLFGDYVLTSTEFTANVTPVSFNHYGLKEAFQSQNSIPLHQTVLGMLRFLGTADGELNDSSWLEEGVALQQSRQIKLEQRHAQLLQDLPNALHVIKCSLQTHIKTLERESCGPFSFFRPVERRTKLDALHKVLACFDEDSQTFNLGKLRSLLETLDKKMVYFGLYFTRTARIISELDELCTEAQVLRLVKNQEPIAFKARHAFSLQQEVSGYFTLKKPRMGWREIAIFVLTSPFLLIRWFISFLLARHFTLLILAPTQVKEQRDVHHVSMSDLPDETENDLVIVNLISHESNKNLKDSVLKLSDFTGLPLPAFMKRRELHLANAKDKQQIDMIIQKITTLLEGTSTSKRCEGKKFSWDKIHFKGMEMLDASLRDYFLMQLNEKFGQVAVKTSRAVKIDFFTLASTEGAVLDSVEISAAGEDTKPMSERTFVINCLAREQNYVNWIKDSAYSAQKIGCTVIAFNYRGIDYSKGMVWTQNNMIDDAVAQVERLLALGVPAKNIGIEGDCIGAAIATLAAAKLHERHYPVKLYNLRSFRSLSRFLEGYMLPEISTNGDWLNPMTYLKYMTVGLLRCVLMPLIWVTGWHLNAAAAWDRIPSSDKDFGVIRNNTDVQHRAPNEADGCIHDSWASMASHMDEQRNTIKGKINNGKTLTQEEKAVLNDKPDRHCFKPSLKPQSDDNDAAQEQAKTYGQHAHFLPRHALVSSQGESQTSHEYMVEFFKRSFFRATPPAKDNFKAGLINNNRG